MESRLCGNYRTLRWRANGNDWWIKGTGGRFSVRAKHQVRALTPKKMEDLSKLLKAEVYDGR